MSTTPKDGPAASPMLSVQNRSTIAEADLTGALKPSSAEMQGSKVTQFRVWQYRMNRWNPIRHLTPTLLASQMDWFDTGDLSQFAVTMEAIAERDDTIKACVLKRKSQVKRLSFEVVLDPDIEESETAAAEEHAKVLRYFYKNLVATNAVDQDQRGGFSLLIEQMMDALLYKYSCHELLWRSEPGQGVTCVFNFVPLRFFENKRGRMRFLSQEGMINGEEMAPTDWMVSVGPCLMRASAVAYMYKNLSLKDWVIYNEKFGMPGVLGKTDAVKDSPAWDAMEEAVAAVNADFAAVINKQDDIMPLDFKGTGQLPYDKLVDRMDRFLAVLWRGGDLSTLSSGPSGVGSNPQNEESDALAQDDAQWVSETLNHEIDSLVIEHVFGLGIKPLAFVKVCAPDRKDIDKEIKVDNHLLTNGCELSKSGLYERYGREQPEPGEETVQPPEPEPAVGGKFGNSRRTFANSQLQRGEREHMALLRNARQRVADAMEASLDPLWDRLDVIMELMQKGDTKAVGMALDKLRSDLPELQKEIARNPVGARALEALMGSGVLNGLTEGHVARN